MGWPRSDARELREEVDRRLSAQPSEACFAACPGLQTLQSDIETALVQSWGSSFSSGEGGESAAEMAELMAGITEITMDAFCTHRPAVQCVVDNPSVCSAGTDEYLEFAPKLDCLCDACPSAKPALAHLMGAFASAFGRDLSGAFGTTTQAFDAGTTTTDIGDGWQDDLTDEDMEMMCAVYPLLSCAVNQPTQCGGDVLIGGIFDMHEVTAVELAQMEETCQNATMTSGTGGDDDDQNSSDSSPPQTPEGESDSTSTAAVEETSNCGFISLGWLSVSLPLMVTALRLDAAR